MKTLALVLVVVIGVTACNAQQKKDLSRSKQTIETGQSMANQPKVNWKVNKKLDKNGNVISYDSTYTWSYTNNKGDSVSVDADSVLESFHRYFNSNFPPLWEKSVGGPLWNDSLMRGDLFRDDFFQNMWKNDFFNMEKVFRQMDSLRNRFFDETYPGMIGPPEKKESKSDKIY
jgi:hypothetical protein